MQQLLFVFAIFFGIPLTTNFIFRAFGRYWPFRPFIDNAQRDARRQADKRASGTQSGLQAQLRQAQKLARHEGLSAEIDEDGNWLVGRHRVTLEIDGEHLVGSRCHTCRKPVCRHVGAALNEHLGS